MGHPAPQPTHPGALRSGQDFPGLCLCPESHPGWFHRALYAGPSVVSRDLAVARADGSLDKLLAKIARLDVFIVDDWAINPLAESERRDFLEICEDRYGTRSTIVTSQLPVTHWHEQIGEPTLADSILDRLVHNAYRIELEGASLRERKIPPWKDPKGGRS